MEQLNIRGKRLYIKLYSHRGRSSAGITSASQGAHFLSLSLLLGTVLGGTLYSITDNNSSLPTRVKALAYAVGQLHHQVV